MPEYRDDGWDVFGATDYMVSYHYTLFGMWGTSHQLLHVNVPLLRGSPEATGELGRMLWQTAIARATAATTIMSSMLWSTGFGVGSWQPAPGPPIGGALFGHQSDRDGSACITFDHVVADKQGSQPFFLPGFPSRLQDGGVLTDVGMRGIEQLCHLLVMSINGRETRSPYTLYNRWPVLDETGHEIPGFFRFRRVHGYRVMKHTARAPDFRPPF